MIVTYNCKNKQGRLDKFLKEGVFFNDKITRGEIIRQIKSGNVLVNGKKIKPSYILKENDVIEHGTWNMEQEALVPNFEIKIDIIYKDENIIVVNKPAGLQVHPDNHEKNNTLANGLIAKFPEIKNVGDHSTSSGQAIMRPGIVHRLDKDTSGIMVIARNQKIFEELKNKFKNREIEKKYWALTYGRVLESGGLGKSGIVSGVIDKPLARSTSYRKQVIAGKKTETKIREAVTHYKVLKTLDNISLLEVTPKTGRMHQIRVHLTSIGHPIVGDKLYKTKTNRTSKTNIIKSRAARQMLHAKSIKFGLFGEDFLFEAPTPPDFDHFLTFGR